jgi:predicted nucleic acid-binding protein
VIAVDTNVLVRYVTDDDPEQGRRALELLGRGEEVFVAKTVLLETEWVLRAVYKLPRASVRGALLHVLGLPNVQAEAPEQIAQALELHERGLDFADAIHLASSGDAETFYTFDGELARRGRALTPSVRLL